MPSASWSRSWVGQASPPSRCELAGGPRVGRTPASRPGIAPSQDTLMSYASQRHLGSYPAVTGHAARVQSDAVPAPLLGPVQAVCGHLLQRAYACFPSLAPYVCRSHRLGRCSCPRAPSSSTCARSSSSWTSPLATSANGQPAAAAYTRDQHGNYRPYGICVLTVTGVGIRRISSFGDSRLVTMFGLRPDMTQAKDAEPAPRGRLKSGGRSGYSATWAPAIPGRSHTGLTMPYRRAGFAGQ